MKRSQCKFEILTSTFSSVSNFQLLLTHWVPHMARKMVNIRLTIVVLMQAFGLSCGGLFDFLNIRYLPATFAKFTNGSFYKSNQNWNKFCEFLYLVAGLQSITTVLGTGGTIAIPFDTICEIDPLNEYIFCFICNQDCYHVHNAYGGSCAKNPLNEKQTCLCAYEKKDAEKRRISRYSTKTCYSLTHFLGKKFAKQINFLIKITLTTLTTSMHNFIMRVLIRSNFFALNFRWLQDAIHDKCRLFTRIIIIKWCGSTSLKKKKLAQDYNI